MTNGSHEFLERGKKYRDLHYSITILYWWSVHGCNNNNGHCMVGVHEYNILPAAVTESSLDRCDIRGQTNRTCLLTSLYECSYMWHKSLGKPSSSVLGPIPRRRSQTRGYRVIHLHNDHIITIGLIFSRDRRVIETRSIFTDIPFFQSIFLIS